MINQMTTTEMTNDCEIKYENKENKTIPMYGCFLKVIHTGYN